MSSKQLSLGHSGVRVSLLAGSATVIGGFLYLLYKSRRDGRDAEFDLPRDTVVQILREFRKEFYTLCKGIAVHSLKMQESLRAQRMPQSQTRAYLEEFYASPESGVPEQVHDIENKVYLKFDVGNRKEFERFYQTLAKEDPAIRAYRNEIRDMFAKAVGGVAVVPQVDVPPQITGETLTAAFRKYYKATLRKMTDFTFDFIALHGRSKVSTPLFQQGFSRLDLDGERNVIALEFGIDFRDDFYPHQLMGLCKEKLERSNAAFAQKMAELESFRFAYIGRLFNQQLTKEAMLEELAHIDVVGVPVVEEARPQPEPLPQPEQPAPAPAQSEAAPFNPPDHNLVTPPAPPAPVESQPHEIALSKDAVLEGVPVIDSAEVGHKREADSSPDK